MRLLLGQDDLVGRYVTERVPGTVLEPGKFTSMGIVDDTPKLICGVVFFNFRPWDIEIGIAADSPRWCQRWILMAIFRYCFWQLGVKRVSGMQAASNTRAHKMVEGLGFKKEGVVRLGWFGREDGWFYGMTKEECRWLEEQQHGRTDRWEGRRRCA